MIQPTLTPAEFAKRWRGVTATEKAASQSHFIDLCRMLGRGGRPPPRRAARRLAQPPELPPDELEKRTLTSLYNLRPTWLEVAHADLDETVLRAYGLPPTLRNAAILESLMPLNEG